MAVLGAERSQTVPWHSLFSFGFWNWTNWYNSCRNSYSNCYLYSEKCTGKRCTFRCMSSTPKHHHLFDGEPRMEASPTPIPRYPQMLPHVTHIEDAKRNGTDAGVLLVPSDSSSTSDSAAPIMLPMRRSGSVPKMRRKDSFSELRSRSRSDSPKQGSDSTFTSSSRGLRAFWTEDGTKSMSFEDCEILEVMSDPTVAIACTFSPHHV